MSSPQDNLHSRSTEAIRRTVKRVTRLLEKRYGVPQHRRSDPLETLIETILSQNTNDKNRDRAYRALKSRFARWDDVLNAKGDSVVEAIRPGGLARLKARRIQGVLRWIQREYGTLSLRSLRTADPEDMKGTFGRLHGVGPKTVHCLLLFGFGQDVFPVDTHVLRVGKRLGFIPEKMNAEHAHRWMSPLVPKGKSLSLHVNLIRLGRSYCRARNPRCPDCFLRRECSVGRSQRMEKGRMVE